MKTASEETSNNNDRSVHPHIQRALTEIQQKNHTKTRLSIGGRSLRVFDCQSAHQICAFLNQQQQTHQVSHLRIQCALSKCATAVVSRFLQQTRFITNLSVCGSTSSSSDVTVLECLAHGLSDNVPTTHLKFCRFDFGRNSPRIFRALCQVLKCKRGFCSIEFDECQFGQDVSGLAETLELQNKSLRNYSMQLCQLEDSGMANLLQHLTTCRALQRLSLCRCRMGSASFGVLNNLLLGDHQVPKLKELFLSSEGMDRSAQWHNQTKPELMNALQCGSDSLQQVHLCTSKPDQVLHAQVQRLMQRNRITAAVRESLQRQSLNHHHNVLGLWSHGLATLASKSPDVGSCGLFLAVMSLSPELGTPTRRLSSKRHRPHQSL